MVLKEKPTFSWANEEIYRPRHGTYLNYPEYSQPWKNCKNVPVFSCINNVPPDTKSIYRLANTKSSFKKNSVTCTCLTQIINKLRYSFVLLNGFLRLLIYTLFKLQCIQEKTNYLNLPEFGLC